MSLFPSLQKLPFRLFAALSSVSRWVSALPAAVWVWASRLAWGFSLVFLGLLALVQWFFLTQLGQYQEQIEAALGSTMGQSVKIGHLSGHWHGLNPGVVLDDVDLVDADGRPSLSLKKVAVFLSWRSLIYAEPVLDLLLIDSPVLQVYRSRSGEITIAGFETEGAANPRVLQALLSLRRVRIQHASLIWEDMLRGAPVLSLEEVNLGLDNEGGTHRLGLTAQPPKELASRLDLRAEWQGDALRTAWAEYQEEIEGNTQGEKQGQLWPEGRLYAEVVSANLPAWQTWVDYPVALPEGRGGVRIWADRRAGKEKLTVDLGISGLSVQPTDWFPHFMAKRLEGRFSWGQESGRPQLWVQDLHAEQLVFSLPQFFPAGSLEIENFNGAGKWRKEGEAPDDWSLKLDTLDLSNKDLEIKLQASSYRHGEAHFLDLQGDVPRGDGRQAWRYVPAVVDAQARRWLESALREGRLSEGKMLIKGDMRQFPFMTPEAGLFKITAQVHEAVLDYAPGWPAVEGIEGELRFEQGGMNVAVRSGQIAGAAVGPVDATIPDLKTLDELLLVKGKAQGSTQAFLTFVEDSPVGEWIGHATHGIHADGEGRLDLSLTLPIRRHQDAKVQGSYVLQRNTVRPLAGLPPIQQVNGRLTFDENGVQIPGLDGIWLGQPAHFQGGGEGVLTFTARGGIGIRELRAALPAEHALQGWLNGLSGQTTWRADIRLPAGRPPQWQLFTDLQGLSSSLPGPLNKTAARKLPTTLMVTSPPWETGKGAPRQSREQWVLRTENLLNGVLQFRTMPDKTQFERGVIALGGAAPRMPDAGLMVALKCPEFRLEDWQPYLGDVSVSGVSQAGTAGAGLGSLPAPNQLSLETGVFQFMGRQMNGVQVLGNAMNGGWFLGVTAPDVAGSIFWNAEGRGFVRADLRRLRLTDVSAASPERSAPGHGSKPLPALDIRVADFVLGEKHLGKLALQAENASNRWRLSQIQLVNPDGTFNGDGAWEMARSTAKTTTRDVIHLNFRLDATDAGRFLDRLNYPGLLRRGSGVLSGRVSWQGRPTAIDYPSLSGTLRVEAGNGQFAKIESGAGRLLSLLSLQALPRRLLLDFSDVFSDGFAFDRIEGDLVINNGVLTTREPLKIEGASAQIAIKGETNLATETQRLEMAVNPRLSSLASMGAAVAINPVVGLTTLLAQKLFSNPMDQVWSHQYTVTGTWSSPVVQKD